MTYANEGIDQKAEVTRGAAADSLVYWVKEQGAPAEVDVGSAFVTVLGQGGDTKVERIAATIAAGGKLSFTQAWPGASYELLEDYIAVWEWAVDGVAFTDRQYFDVVANKLICPVDTSDLEEVYPNIVAMLRAVQVTDATRFIRRAWSKILDRIRGSGSRPALILDRARLVNPTLELALSHACGSLCRRENDLWDVRREEHRKEFETLFRSLGSLRYDKDEDGTAAERETARPNRRGFSV